MRQRSEYLHVPHLLYGNKILAWILKLDHVITYISKVINRDIDDYF